MYPFPTVGRAFLCSPAQALAISLALVILSHPLAAKGEATDWSVGVFGGKYYDTEPAGILEGNARFMNQHILGLTASRTLWRASSLPASLELDGMLGYQFGLASLGEAGVAPALRWGGFPWNEVLHTEVRLAPLGISYTTSVGPLERGSSGKGSRWLNLLFLELSFALPNSSAESLFVRLHHRCDIYDVLNKNGANGEDFLVLGFRHHY